MRCAVVGRRHLHVVCGGENHGYLVAYEVVSGLKIDVRQIRHGYVALGVGYVGENGYERAGAGNLKSIRSLCISLQRMQRIRPALFHPHP